MLEPRRLAARAAAHRMAFLRGEAVGRTIGYRTRLDTRVSAATRVEVVTEGVLTRMVQQDPTLDGYGLVIFDEFHERSLQADTGLALVHAHATARPPGPARRSHVGHDRRHRGRSTARRCYQWSPHRAASSTWRRAIGHHRPARAASGHFDAAFVAGVIRSAISETDGDVLVFLPGAPEIHRVLDSLALGQRRHRCLRAARHACTRRTGSRDRAVTSGSSQGRPVDLDRGNQPHDRRRARRHRHRPRATLAIFAANGHVNARNHARVARLGGPASRARRANGTRHVLPVVERRRRRRLCSRSLRPKSSKATWHRSRSISPSPA